MELTFDYLNNVLPEITEKREVVRKKVFNKLGELSREEFLDLVVKSQRDFLTKSLTSQLNQLIVAMAPEKI